MPFEFFLAQSAAEFGQALPICAKKAWMACHFSPWSTGLSNLPDRLPEGSMLIVDDSVPAADHDPERIAGQLKQLAQSLRCSRVLLDFQRPGERRTADIAKAIVAAVPCPVGVSEIYARELSCPVFLPPLPLHMPLDEYLAPWSGRPVWLELMPACAAYTVTEEGCQTAVCEATGDFPHFDERACCRYRIEIMEQSVRFTLCRSFEELARLRQREQVDCFVGLYQEFAQPEAQATAFAQCQRRSARSSSEI